MRGAVHFRVRNAHAVHFRAAAELVDVQYKRACIAGQVQFPGLPVEPGPGVRRQGAVQAAPAVQQVIAQFLLPAEQFRPVDHIDAGAGEHKQVVRSLDPDIVIVVVREIVQRADRIIRIHIAQAVAGHQENAAGLFIRDRPQDDFGTQSVRAGQHLRDLAAVQHRHAVSVRACQNGSVRQFADRQHFGRHPYAFLDPVIPDKAQARVAARGNRPVRKLADDAGPVVEPPVFRVIQMLLPVRADLDQAAAVGADPEAPVAVDRHAADPDACKLFGQFVPDPALAAEVHGVQSFVRAEVEGAVPFHDRVDDPVVQANRGIDVPEIGGSHAQQAEPGGREPDIALIVHQHVVDGIVEVIRIDAFEMTRGRPVSHAVVSGDEKFSRRQVAHVLDAFQVAAGPDVRLLKPALRNVKNVNFVPRRRRQQLSVRREGAAFERVVPVLDQPPGTADLPSPKQVKHAAVGHRGHIPFPVRGAVIRVGHFRQRIDPLQAVVQRKDLHGGGGADIVVSVRAADNGADRIGWKARALVDHIGHLPVDHNAEAVVVRSDPQAPFLIHIQAVDVADGFIRIHPGELPSIIPVQAGVGADPQNAVVRLGDIVGLAAGQAVGAGIDRLHIVVVIDRIRGRDLVRPRPGLHSRNGKRHREQDGQQARCGLLVRLGGLRHFFLFRFLVSVRLVQLLLFLLPALRLQAGAPAVQPDHDIQHNQDGQLVQHFHIELADRQAQEERNALLRQEAGHRVAPEVSGTVGAENKVQRGRDDGRGHSRHHGCRQNAQQVREPLPPRGQADHQADCDADNAVDPVVAESEIIHEIRRRADQRAADGTAQVGCQRRTGGIQPHRQLVRYGKQASGVVSEDTKRDQHAEPAELAFLQDEFLHFRRILPYSPGFPARLRIFPLIRASPGRKKAPCSGHSYPSAIIADYQKKYHVLSCFLPFPGRKFFPVPFYIRKDEKGVFRMRKPRLFLLCLFLSVCLVSGALAQEVSCPAAHLILSVPDPWTVVPLSAADDPDLCLLLEGKEMTLAVYVTDVNGVLPDSFEVLLGNETESGTDVRSGKTMDYVAGTSEEGDYRIYTWLDERNQVQLYFLIYGQPQAALKTIGEIMDSIEFR